MSRIARLREAAEPPEIDPVTAGTTPQPEAAVEASVDFKHAALAVLLALGIGMVLRYAQTMIIPVVLSILLSYALDPLVNLLQRLRIPRVAAAALILISTVAATATVIYQLRYEANAIVQQLPDAARRLRQTLEQEQPGTTSPLKQVQKAATELEKAASAAAPPPPSPSVQRVQVEAPPVRVSDYLLWGSVSIAAAGAQLILILFLTFFLLASGDLYRRKLVKMVGPSLMKKKVTVQILQQIDRQIERFLLVQLFTSTVVGVASWLAFKWAGLEQPGVWGLLAGIFNSIPYFGPVLVTGSTAVVAFMQFGAISPSLTVAGLAFAITTLEGFLLTPWLTSRAASMNAVAVFVGLLYWGWVWNIWGMLLAVPLLMMIKTVCDHVDDLKPVGELLGD